MWNSNCVIHGPPLDYKDESNGAVAGGSMRVCRHGGSTNCCRPWCSAEWGWTSGAWAACPYLVPWWPMLTAVQWLVVKQEGGQAPSCAGIGHEPAALSSNLTILMRLRFIEGLRRPWLPTSMCRLSSESLT